MQAFFTPAFARLRERFLTPLELGRHRIRNRVFVAPMAGVTDRPFRLLCKRLGADYAVGEMAASNALLWATEKTSRRINHDGEPSPKAVQIAGADPDMMGQAARFNIDRGAEVIDINMGCPAKKVCHKAAGSALMRDEALVRAILESVVRAAEGTGVPVTLKMRTGWSAAERNAVQLAQMAESIGVAMVTVHGRTREDKYMGAAEYDTIAAVKQAVGIPVVANGDIDSAQKAAEVLAITGADAVMIGRAGQGNPSLYASVYHYLRTGELRAPPSEEQIAGWLHEHLLDHYAFHGEYSGVRSARKHIGWTLRGLPGAKVFRERIHAAQTAEAQLHAVDEFFAQFSQPQRQAA
ncbi:MAG: tRNA dihydrouridine synthase DusB [Betaproteobacteria bacterium]|nr:tRNA dihydrouridine synthase DusB [Betaproteobacteria bacterium]NCA15974.1 tRNA dihydrouridine synthase DusB [Betaproteobacteria bacterium]